MGITLGTPVWPPQEEFDGPYQMRKVLVERETGFEPATFSLARRCSTPEPLPHYAVPAAPSQLIYYIVYPAACQARAFIHDRREHGHRHYPAASRATSAQEVEMKVENALAGIGPDVPDQPVAGFGDAFLLGDLVGALQ